MTTLALILLGVYMLLAVGLRMLIQLRRTGSTGFHGIGGRPGTAEWVASVGLTLALVLGAAAPVCAALEVVEPIAALDIAALHVAGLVLVVTGIGLTVYAQMAMGDSWRVGVDPGELTPLVTSGPFAVVRNPIFAATLPVALGLALLVPNWLALLGLATLVCALELQVRVVEEPYLAKVHGESFIRYASRVGRFIPGVGRLRVKARPST